MLNFILRPDERGEQIAADLNAYLAKARESGEIAAINDKWRGTDESLKVIDRSGLTGEKGTIHLAISASEPTLDYLKDGEPVGSEVDIITHFCTEYGYDLQVDTLDYTAMTPAITACKYDIAAAAFEYSEERAQSVRFSDKICDEDLVLVVLDKDSTANTTSFLQSATNSFIKTFIQGKPLENVHQRHWTDTAHYCPFHSFRYVPRFWCIPSVPQRRSDLQHHIPGCYACYSGDADGGTADGFLLYYTCQSTYCGTVGCHSLLYGSLSAAPCSECLNPVSRL